MEDIPTVTILLLGDAEVGKSTFLSYVSSPSRDRLEIRIARTTIH